MSENRSLLARILVSPEEPRLRAGWRLLLNALLIQFLSLLALLPFLFLRLPQSLIINGQLISVQTATVIVVTVAVFICRRWLDRRSIASLGLQLDRQSGIDLLAGFLVAGLMMLAVFAIQWGAGWLTIGAGEPEAASGWRPILLLLVMLGAFIGGGWQEELYFRGYLLQNLEAGLNLTWGVVISTVMFSLAHVFNPNLSAMGLLGILLAGFFMAYAYLRSGRLWLPVGLHIGWNFFEGPVFGFSVSGLDTLRLVHTQIGGPELITGGAFGPEAGLVLLPALALGLVCVQLLTRRRAQTKNL